MKPIRHVLSSGILLGVVLTGGSAAGQRVKGEIDESEFDRKLRTVQESAYSPWMAATEAFEVVRRAKLDGRLLLAGEVNPSGQIRVLLHFPQDGKGGDFVYEHEVPEDRLLERHAIWQKQDYNILFAGKNPSGNYFAVWINSARFGAAVSRLNEVGISTAVIRLKSGDTPDVPVAKASVTAPLRQWRDKTGRVLQASVEGIDGPTVNFVRADGKKFPYALADLSEADQKYLAELQSKSGPAFEADGAAATEGLTPWMSRADFDTRVVEERSKGRFAIYAESNSRNEMRALFDKPSKPASWFNGWAQPEQSLREKHASYQEQGYLLLSLSLDRRTDRYCAVWVKGMTPGDAKAQLGKHGMTTASIDEKITVTTPPKR